MSRDEGKSWGPSEQAGMALVAALLLLAVLFLLGTALLAMSDMEYRIAANDEWSEGALHAAEAGIHAGLDQLTFDPATSTAAIPLRGVGGDYTFRSGRRQDAGPQPLAFLGTAPESGYTLNEGTGYNPSGYMFLHYRIQTTGGGPRNAQRELEARARFGPLSN